MDRIIVALNLSPYDENYEDGRNHAFGYDLYSHVHTSNELERIKYYLLHDAEQFEEIFRTKNVTRDYRYYFLFQLVVNICAIFSIKLESYNTRGYSPSTEFYYFVKYGVPVYCFNSVSSLGIHLTEEDTSIIQDYIKRLSSILDSYKFDYNGYVLTVNLIRNIFTDINYPLRLYIESFYQIEEITVDNLQMMMFNIIQDDDTHIPYILSGLNSIASLSNFNQYLKRLPLYLIKLITEYSNDTAINTTINMNDIELWRLLFNDHKQLIKLIKPQSTPLSRFSNNDMCYPSDPSNSIQNNLKYNNNSCWFDTILYLMFKPQSFEYFYNLVNSSNYQKGKLINNYRPIEDHFPGLTQTLFNIIKRDILNLALSIYENDNIVSEEFKSTVIKHFYQLKYTGGGNIIHFEYSKFNEAVTFYNALGMLFGFDTDDVEFPNDTQSRNVITLNGIQYEDFDNHIHIGDTKGYELVGVLINQYGTHYISYLKINDEWYYYNDTNSSLYRTRGNINDIKSKCMQSYGEGASYPELLLFVKKENSNDSDEEFYDLEPEKPQSFVERFTSAMNYFSNFWKK